MRWCTWSKRYTWSRWLTWRWRLRFRWRVQEVQQDDQMEVEVLVMVWSTTLRRTTVRTMRVQDIGGDQQLVTYRLVEF
jgi:hypothetical protein